MGWGSYLQIFAGLGLFFVGINLLSDSLKNFGKPYVRKFVNQLAGTDAKAVLSGALSGAVTNSGKAVTFSITGLVSAGTLTPRQCLPIILGASFGSSLLVLWVSVDFKLLELALLGVAGLYYQFGDMKSEKIKFVAALSLGLGLIFFGLDMLKSGSGTLRDNAQFIHFLSSTHGYWLIALALGAVGAFVTQSGSTISIVAITFMASGLLDFNQTVMFVYGTNIGSGVSTAMLALTMAGTSRQLVMFHASVKIVGALLLVPLLYLETYAHVPGIKAFAAIFTSSPATQIGVIYVAYEVISALGLLLFLGPAAKLLNILWPPTKEEVLSKLEFIPYVAPSDVHGMATAIEAEQTRLLNRVSHYFDQFRPQMAKEQRAPRTALHEANKSVQNDIERHLAALLKQPSLSEHTLERLFFIHAVQRWVTGLNKRLNEFVEILEKGRSQNLPDGFLTETAQKLDELLMVACYSATTQDLASLQFLVASTQQAETLMRRFEDTKRRAITPLSVKSKKTLLEILVCYDAITWSVHNLAHTLQQYLESREEDAVVPGAWDASEIAEPPHGSQWPELSSTIQAYAETAPRLART